MNKISKTLGTLWVLFLSLFTTLHVGCQPDVQTEIPITTASEEAREVFIEARVLEQLLRDDEARELFSKAIAIDPDFALAHLYRALTATSALYRQLHLGHARALKTNVSDGERLMIEAILASEEDRPSKSIELLEQLVEKFPNDKRAYQRLGTAYWWRAEYEKAINEYKIAIALDVDFAPSYNMLGYSYRARGEYGKAEEAFQKYTRLLPREANPQDSIADLYTKMGNHSYAIEHYMKAIALNPRFSLSQRNIGTNLVFLGGYVDARAAYRKAMDMEQTAAGKFAGMDLIAASYVYEGSYRQARSEAKNILQMASEENLPEWRAGAHVMSCEIYIELGELAKAAQSDEACTQVVRDSDLSPATEQDFQQRALFYKGIIAAKHKDFEKAAAIVDEYRAMVAGHNDPRETENLHTLMGHIYNEKSDYAKAVEQLQQGDQENPFTLYHLALAQSRLGNSVEASELFEKVAYWNEHSLGYALVRSRAMSAIGPKSTKKR